MWIHFGRVLIIAADAVGPPTGMAGARPEGRGSKAIGELRSDSLSLSLTLSLALRLSLSQTLSLSEAQTLSLCLSLKMYARACVCVCATVCCFFVKALPFT